MRCTWADETTVLEGDTTPSPTLPFSLPPLDLQSINLEELFPDGIPSQEPPVYPGHPDEHFEALPPVYNILPVQTPIILLQYNTATSTAIPQPLTLFASPTKASTTNTGDTQPLSIQESTSAIQTKIPKSESTTQTEMPLEDLTYPVVTKTNTPRHNTVQRTERTRLSLPPTTTIVTTPRAALNYMFSRTPGFGQKITTKNNRIALIKTRIPNIRKTHKDETQTIENHIIETKKNGHKPIITRATVKWARRTRPATSNAMYYINTQTPTKLKTPNRLSFRNKHRPSPPQSVYKFRTTTKVTDLPYRANTGQSPVHLLSRPQIVVSMNDQVKDELEDELNKHDDVRQAQYLTSTPEQQHTTTDRVTAAEPERVRGMHQQRTRIPHSSRPISNDERPFKKLQSIPIRYRPLDAIVLTTQAAQHQTKYTHNLHRDTPRKKQTSVESYRKKLYPTSFVIAANNYRKRQRRLKGLE